MTASWNNVRDSFSNCHVSTAPFLSRSKIKYRLLSNNLFQRHGGSKEPCGNHKLL